MSVLYITQNGVTDHIGRSQVAPYVLGLASKGFNLHVLSAEKNLDSKLVGEYQQLFDQAGVRWTRVQYCNKPRVIGQLLTQRVMYKAACALVGREHIKVIHCRSFPPAVLGRKLKRRYGVKYIFDFRDFYADGGLKTSTGLARLVYQRLKRIEGPLIREAEKVVCLTVAAKSLLTKWYLSDVADTDRRFQVIPCCADFDVFDIGRVSTADQLKALSAANLEGDDFVLLYLGSLGPDYLLPKMIALFKQLLALKPEAYFLFVANNGEGLVLHECRRQGVALDRIRFVGADRTEIPALLSLAKLSVIFIRADESKAGCSPTKLAELFACNVPVIANSGVGDMDQIINPLSNGSVLVNDFADASLAEALAKILKLREKPIDIREHSREFDLVAGVECYANVYRELLS